MATVNMNAIHFYNPPSTVPSLSARCAAALQRHHQSTAIPHRKEWSHVLESYSQSQEVGNDIEGKQDHLASGNHITADDNDDLPPLEEVLYRSLHVGISTRKPTHSTPTIPGTDKTSFLDGSSSSMSAQSSPLGHLDGSKEQPVILDDDDDIDDGADDDDSDGDDDHDNSSSRGIFRDLNAAGIGRELSPPPSLTTPYTMSMPSSSYNPSLYPSAALHNHLQEDYAIQQDNGYISCEMSEQPSCPALMLADNKGDETEKAQQAQPAGENGEQGSYDSDKSGNSDIDDKESYLQESVKMEGLPPAIRRSSKRRLQRFDNGASTMRSLQQQHQEIGEEKDQVGHDSDSVSGSHSGSDRGCGDDQDSDDSEAPRPAKQHRLSCSSNDSTLKFSKKQRLQRTRHSRLASLSQPARADLTIQKEPQQPSSLVSDESDDSEAPRPAKRRRPSWSISDCTSNRSQQVPSKRRSRSPLKLGRSHTASPQTQLDLSVNSNNCAQSQQSSTYSLEDDEQMSTTAEYREWPMHGFIKRTTIGNEIRYSMDFSLEQLRGLCATTCLLHATSPSSNRDSSVERPNRYMASTCVKKTQLAPPSRNKRMLFTSKEDALLVNLKNKGWSWKHIGQRFPQRTLGALQVHYCMKLKSKVLTDRSDSD